jgi:hypothetical protein
MPQSLPRIALMLGNFATGLSILALAATAVWAVTRERDG